MSEDGVSKEQGEKDLGIAKIHAAAMREHFDSVQIFATRNEGSQGTVTVSFGLGDWYARYGLAKFWCVKQEHPETTPDTTE